MTLKWFSASSAVRVTNWPVEGLIVLALGAGVLLAAPLNTDSAYCLVAGRRLLEGERLYVDMIETNPPMIFWLMSGVAWVGRFVDLPDDLLVGCFLAVTLVVSSVSGFTAMTLAPAAPRAFRFIVLSTFLAASIVPFVSWSGQREQIAAILTLPYTLLSARRASGFMAPRGFALWTGVLAAVGLAIKPFFLAAWVAIELAVLIATRRWRSSARPELLAVVSLQIVYGLAVIAVTPEYLTEAIPFAAALYGAYGRGVTAVLEQKRVWLIAAIGVSAWWSDAPQGHSNRDRYAAVFAAATLGWLLAYVAQGKGWYYHLLPAIVFATVSALLTANNLREDLVTFFRKPWRHRIRGAAIVLPVAAGAMGILPAVLRLPEEQLGLLINRQPEVVVRMSRVLHDAAAGEPAYFLSTTMWPAFPVVNMSGVTWPYHYHFLWPIPSLYSSGPLEYRSPDEQGTLERRFFSTVVDDLRRFPPRILVIDRRREQQAMRRRRFDFVEYFSASPEFRALFARYRRLGFIDQWEFYEMR